MMAGCGGVAGTIAGGAGGGCAKITDIENVVILIQENRSFDHYFGSYKGVRGFNDQSAAFQQPYPGNTGNAPAGVLLPYHLDMSKTNAACTHDIIHDWVPQHQSWNNGAMDGFVTSRIPINANDAVMTMGYYDRADLPYYYARGRCLYALRQLFLPGDRPQRSQSPLHDGCLTRSGWNPRRAAGGDPGISETASRSLAN